MGKRIAFILALVAAVLLLVAPAAMAAIAVTDISPGWAERGWTVDCTVYGSFHHPLGINVDLPEFTLVHPGHTITGTTTGINATGTRAYVTFNIPALADLGWYTLEASQYYGPFPPDTDSLGPYAFQVMIGGPDITGTNPTAVMAGSGSFMLTVYGDHFRSSSPGYHGSEIEWNGVHMDTTYYSSTTLTAFIPAAAVAYPGTVGIVVHNVSDGTVSNTWSFNVAALPPTISALSPSSTAAGGPAFSLGVTGWNFVTGPYGAVVRWNSTDLATVRDSSTHLTATVPASLITTVGTATITVRNGPGGYQVSNGLTFTVVYPTPVMGAISPTSVWAGYVKNDVVLTVTGSNFINGARIVLSGGEKTGTTFVGATQLTVPLAAADIAAAGTLMVSVKNPPFPPGYPSAGALPLTVQAESTTPMVTISGADTAWHNAPVPLTFTATDAQSGVQKVQYMAPPTVGSWTDGTSYTVPTSAQGAITVSVQALDWCNKVGTASATVNIDTTKPKTKTLGSVSVKKGATAKLTYRVEEPSGLSPRADVVIKVLKSDGSQAKKLTLDDVKVNGDRTARFTCNLKKGTYTWNVYATDLAGNTQANVAQAKLTVK
jgi:hypothetical protein